MPPSPSSAAGFIESPCGLVVEDEVRLLGLAARHQLAAHDDAALGEAHLLADLQQFVPTRLTERRRDELGTDVAFAEGALIHDGQSFLDADRLMGTSSNDIFVA